jgi:hypothetical protein
MASRAVSSSHAQEHERGKGGINSDLDLISDNECSSQTRAFGPLVSIVCILTRGDHKKKETGRTSLETLAAFQIQD